MSLKRFQRTIARAGDGATMTTVVEQRIHGFLQHALFVADDDFRRLELEQVLQPVVAVDDAAIEIVQVGRGKTSAFERNERTQIRRNHRQHREDHPFRPALARPAKPWSSLIRLAIFLRICLLLVSVIASCNSSICLCQVDFGERFAHGFRAHLGDERIRAVGFAGFAIFVLRSSN